MKDLRAAVPFVRPARRRDGGNRQRLLRGIAIRGAQSEGPRPSPAHGHPDTAGPGWAEDHRIAFPKPEATTETDEIERLAALIRNTQARTDPTPETTSPDEEAPNRDRFDDDDDADLDLDALKRQA